MEGRSNAGEDQTTVAEVAEEEFVPKPARYEILSCIDAFRWSSVAFRDTMFREGSLSSYSERINHTTRESSTNFRKPR